MGLLGAITHAAGQLKDTAQLKFDQAKTAWNNTVGAVIPAATVPTPSPSPAPSPTPPATPPQNPPVDPETHRETARATAGASTAPKQPTSPKEAVQALNSDGDTATISYSGGVKGVIPDTDIPAAGSVSSSVTVTQKGDTNPKYVVTYDRNKYLGTYGSEGVGGEGAGVEAGVQKTDSVTFTFNSKEEAVKAVEGLEIADATYLAKDTLAAGGKLPGGDVLGGISKVIPDPIQSNSFLREHRTADSTTISGKGAEYVADKMGLTSELHAEAPGVTKGTGALSVTRTVTYGENGQPKTLSYEFSGGTQNTKQTTPEYVPIPNVDVSAGDNKEESASSESVTLTWNLSPEEAGKIEGLSGSSFEYAAVDYAVLDGRKWDTTVHTTTDLKNTGGDFYEKTTTTETTDTASGQKTTTETVQGIYRNSLDKTYYAGVTLGPVTLGVEGRVQLLVDDVNPDVSEPVKSAALDDAVEKSTALKALSPDQRKNADEYINSHRDAFEALFKNGGNPEDVFKEITPRSRAKKTIETKLRYGLRSEMVRVSTEKTGSDKMDVYREFYNSWPEPGEKGAFFHDFHIANSPNGMEWLKDPQTFRYFDGAEKDKVGADIENDENILVNGTMEVPTSEGKTETVPPGLYLAEDKGGKSYSSARYARKKNGEPQKTSIDKMKDYGRIANGVEHPYTGIIYSCDNKAEAEIVKKDAQVVGLSDKVIVFYYDPNGNYTMLK